MNYDVTKEQLKERFKQYAINVAFFVLKLPYNIVNKKYSDPLDRVHREQRPIIGLH
jgi:hypothetical protein